MIQIQKKNGLSIIINNFNKTNEVKRQSEDKIDIPLNEVLNEEIPFDKKTCKLSYEDKKQNAL